MEKILRTLLSIGLAVIMLCVSIGGASTASAETTEDSRTINVMIWRLENWSAMSLMATL